VDDLIAELLAKWKAGDKAALRELIPLMYEQLHRLARHMLRGERHEHTLQSTALINEVYLRLQSQIPGRINDGAHFLGVAAHLMRQILVDYARAQSAAKRDGGRRVELTDSMHPVQIQDIDVLALDKALEALGDRDPDMCRVVELRYFVGLSVEETAVIMGVSAATVKRDWAMARAWLARELRGAAWDPRGAAPGLAPREHGSVSLPEPRALEPLSARRPLWPVAD
jgi:RNA polymerase sigma factor (TIGR02999 family)